MNQKPSTTVRIAFIFDRPTVNLRTSPGILTFEYPQGFTLLVELLQLLHIPQDPDDRASESIFMILDSLKVLFIFFNCMFFSKPRKTLAIQEISYSLGIVRVFSITVLGAGNICFRSCT